MPGTVISSCTSELFTKIFLLFYAPPIKISMEGKIVKRIKRVGLFSGKQNETASLIAQGFTVIPIPRSLSDGVATNNPTISDYGNDKNK